MTTATERLEQLLDAKDIEIESLQSKLRQAEAALEGAAEGWRTSEEFPDDPALPVPRLELVYKPNGEGNWGSYRVNYRLVLRHLLGHCQTVALSYTRVSGGPRDVPPNDLPFRDGAHAAHDSVHLGIPVFKLMPGARPVRIDFDGYEHQTTLGLKHRRTAPPASTPEGAR